MDFLSESAPKSLIKMSSREYFIHKSPCYKGCCSNDEHKNDELIYNK